MSRKRIPWANCCGSDQFWVCAHGVPFSGLVQQESWVPGMMRAVAHEPTPQLVVYA
ncbi:hypothetical protein [Jongsikchunia kroppenstedtii]|uniref:hypothetical protein n=1 Tax=Jongsikchunia kroppenstedtii TaxID=1121721 RepID=UPI0003682EFC|nr:hypothetical protein [Jongsikchunia kroppenstedtii]